MSTAKISKNARSFLLSQITYSEFLKDNPIRRIAGWYRIYVWGGMLGLSRTWLATIRHGSGSASMDEPAVNAIEELFRQHGLSLDMSVPKELKKAIREEEDRIVRELEADDRDSYGHMVRDNIAAQAAQRARGSR